MNQIKKHKLLFAFFLALVLAVGAGAIFWRTSYSTKSTKPRIGPVVEAVYGL